MDGVDVDDEVDIEVVKTIELENVHELFVEMWLSWWILLSLLKWSSC